MKTEKAEERAKFITREDIYDENIRKEIPNGSKIEIIYGKEFDKNKVKI